VCDPDHLAWVRVHLKEIETRLELLNYVMPAWLAALIVGVVVGIVSWMLISKAMRTLQTMEMKPQHTVESLKEDAQWIKEQIS